MRPAPATKPDVPQFVPPSREKYSFPSALPGVHERSAAATAVIFVPNAWRRMHVTLLFPSSEHIRRTATRSVRRLSRQLRLRSRVMRTSASWHSECARRPSSANASFNPLQDSPPSSDRQTPLLPPPPIPPHRAETRRRRSACPRESTAAAIGRHSSSSARRRRTGKQTPRHAYILAPRDGGRYRKRPSGPVRLGDRSGASARAAGSHDSKSAVCHTCPDCGPRIKTRAIGGVPHARERPARKGRERKVRYRGADAPPVGSGRGLSPNGSKPREAEAGLWRCDTQMSPF